MVGTAYAPRDLEGSPRLHYLEWAGPGPDTALLVHGSFGNAHVWTDFAPQLAQALRVVTPDLRGHGASAWAADGDYGLEALVADLQRLLDGLAGGGRLVLAGHSLGNVIAARLAALHGARVRALVLVDHALRFEPDHRQHLVDIGARPAREFSNREEALAWARRLAGRGNSLETIVAATAAANIVPKAGGGFRQAFDQRFLASLDLWDAEPDMDAIVCPVLIVRADVEPVLRAGGAERMLAGLRNARLVTIEGAGHNVFIERPAEFAALVLTFIKEALSGASRG